MSKNDYRDYLMHYNHNHDRLGRFASSGVGRVFNTIESAHARGTAKQYDRAGKRQATTAKALRKMGAKKLAKVYSKGAANNRYYRDVNNKYADHKKDLVQRSKNQRISDIQSKRGVSRAQAETIYKRQRNAKIAGAIGAAAGGAALVYKAKKGGGVPRLGYGHLGVGTSAKPAKRIASKTVPRIASATTGYRDVVSRAPISNYPAVRRNTGTALRTISNVEPYSIRKELTPKGKAIIGGAAAGAGAVGAYKYKKSRKKK